MPQVTKDTSQTSQYTRISHKFKIPSFYKKLGTKKKIESPSDTVFHQFSLWGNLLLFLSRIE